jgi:hypothetical protein
MSSVVEKFWGVVIFWRNENSVKCVILAGNRGQYNADSFKVWAIQVLLS